MVLDKAGEKELERRSGSSRMDWWSIYGTAFGCCCPIMAKERRVMPGSALSVECRVLSRYPAYGN